MATATEHHDRPSKSRSSCNSGGSLPRHFQAPPQGLTHDHEPQKTNPKQHNSDDNRPTTKADQPHEQQDPREAKKQQVQGKEMLSKNNTSGTTPKTASHSLDMEQMISWKLVAPWARSTEHGNNFSGLDKTLQAESALKSKKLNPPFWPNN